MALHSIDQRPASYICSCTSTRHYVLLIIYYFLFSLWFRKRKIIWLTIVLSAARSHVEAPRDSTSRSMAVLTGIALIATV